MFGGRVVSYFQHLASSCGWQAEGYQETVNRRGKLEAESAQISRKLESVGIPTRQENQGVYVVGDLSGRCEKLDDGYRHINLIPVVAQRERRELSNQLEYYIDTHNLRRYARYAVITSGQRIPFFGNLKDIRAKHTRRISKWASESARNWGVMVLLRSDELTFKRSPVVGMNGCHLHSNVVYFTRKKMTKAKWSAWLEWSHKKLGGVHWRDCGRLKDVREVVKYVSKLSYGSQGLTKAERDGGMLGLNELTADELGWLFRETYRAKMCQAMGNFANYRRVLTIENTRIRSVRLRSGRVSLARVRRSKNVTKPNVPGAGRVDNIVLGRMASHPRFSDTYEPCTLVKNYNPQTETGMGRIGLDVIQSNARQATRWAKQNRKRWGLNVHTMTLTVPTLDTTKHEKPDNPPPVPCSIERNDVPRPDNAPQDAQTEGVKVAKRPKGLTLMPSGCVSSLDVRDNNGCTAEEYARARCKRSVVSWTSRRTISPLSSHLTQ